MIWKMLATWGVVMCLAAPIGAQVSAPEAVAAIRAAEDGDWDIAYAQAPDAVTRDVVTWLRLREGAGVFADYLEFTPRRADWPRMDRVRGEGEQALEKGHDPAEVVAWFGANVPVTGEGAVRLAEAYYALGEPLRAETVIRAAWRDQRYDQSGHEALVSAFPDLLQPLHFSRAQALVWRWRTADAERMLPLLSEEERALIRARLGYVLKLPEAEARAAEVPEAFRNDPGLAYDRYNWLADTGRRAEAVGILIRRSTSAEALGEPFRWSGWRRSLARWEMRNGNPQRALAIATQHFLTDGAAYADLEWLAGYLQLTYLNDPAAALEHFRRSDAAVDGPISDARAGYWQGRAHAALGQADEAYDAYSKAADHQTAFYGLLASEKIGRPLDNVLTGRGDPADWQGAAVMQDELVRAAFALLEGGARGAAFSFFSAAGRELGADDIARVSAALMEMDEEYYALLLGKSGVARGILVPSAYYPVHALAEMELPVDPALALSIARRESEFNEGIGSPVGALGLMQLMPPTAEEMAGFLGEAYSRARLTSDWRYNARLGARYLQELEETFGPSPVQIAVGYNAGPSRAFNWMDDYGDPRLREVEVVDWIEHIPFRETRNYVMRVTESIPIYQARVSGQTGPVSFTRLLLGEKPVLRPEARPGSLGNDGAAQPDVRPRARP